MSLRSTWSGDVDPSPEVDLAQLLSRMRNQFPEIRSSAGNLQTSTDSGRGPSPQWQSPEKANSHGDMAGISLSASMPGRSRSPPSLSPPGAEKWERDIAFLMAENAKIKEGMARASERLAQHKQELALTAEPSAYSTYEFSDRRSPYDFDRRNQLDQSSTRSSSYESSEHRIPLEYSSTRPPPGQSESSRGAPLSASLSEEDWEHMHPLPQMHGALFSSAPSQPRRAADTASSWAPYGAHEAASAAASAAAAHVARTVERAPPPWRPHPPALPSVVEEGVFSDYPEISDYPTYSVKAEVARPPELG